VDNYGEEGTKPHILSCFRVLHSVHSWQKII
jgi:hypothetical protein